MGILRRKDLYGPVFFLLQLSAMKITTKFIGSSALLILLTAIFSGSGFVIKQRSEWRLNQVHTQTQAVANNVVALKIALQDQSTALNRWSVLGNKEEEHDNYEQAKARFVTALDQLETLIPAEETLARLRLDGIRRQQQYLETLAVRLENADRNQTSNQVIAEAVTRSLQVFASSTNVQVQALLENATSQSILARDQQLSNRRRIALLDIMSFSAVLLLLLAQFYGLLRPVMRSLRELEAGVSDIDGKNPTPIALPKRGTGDEIQALASAFNNMSERLKVSYQELERRVAERTASLNHTNQALVQEIEDRSKTEDQLQETLQQLQATQLQLLQTEKMSSLNKLVAGVAHEINNPASFIKGNLEPAEQYMNSLLRLIEHYQAEYPEASQELQQIAKDADLPFIQSDFPMLLASIRNGVERITTIVRSLQTFSHLDESETKAVDLHEGLDSALLILSAQLTATSARPKITVVKHYGNLPKVYCYPSQLNQVFMGLLTNAIDAINNRDHQASDPSAPTITIHTQAQGGCVQISIADNGIGMNADQISQIFDPFFTTKTVGEGVGLGLSMSYQIVKNNHQGLIKCASEPGKGTTFSMTIPLSLKIQHSSPLLAAA